MKARSVMMTPRPWQAGQPPAEFGLNNAAGTPLRRANSLRMAAAIPVYVIGVERPFVLTGR
jgi:hypothetical protein